MFGWGVVFTIVALLVLVYVAGVSDDSYDYWFGMTLFSVVFTLGYILKTLF